MQFVKTYAFNLERWARYTITIIGGYIWIRATLNVFGLLVPLKSWFAELREITWTVGTVVISIDAIVDFILVLIITFILVKVIRILYGYGNIPTNEIAKRASFSVSI